jgi:hypothetical protein
MQYRKNSLFWVSMKWLFVFLLGLVWIAILPLRIWASVTGDPIPRGIFSWGLIIAYLICLVTSFAYAIQICRLLRQSFWKSRAFSNFLKHVRISIC